MSTEVKEPQAQETAAEFDAVMAELDTLAKSVDEKKSVHKSKDKKKSEDEEAEREVEEDEEDAQDEEEEADDEDEEADDEDEDKADDLYTFADDDGDATPGDGPPPEALRRAGPPQAALQKAGPVVRDGEKVVKGFHRTMKKSLGELRTVLAQSRDESRQEGALMAKALHAIGRRIGALEAELAAIGRQPQMRKSVLTAAASGAPKTDPCSRDEFLAKSIRCGGQVASQVAQYLTLNPDRPIAEAVPPHLYQVVMAAEHKAA